MPSHNPFIEITRQTYDRLAAEHAERFWSASLERAWEAFAKRLPPRASVLDLGCGAGRDVAALSRMGYRVTGLDLSFGLLCEARNRLEGRFTQGDMSAIPFPKAHFDAVWMCASLLHIPREQAPGVLWEVQRVTGVGSLLYAAVQRGQGEGWKGVESPRFFTYYQEDELGDLVMQAGFEVERSWIEETPAADWINLLAWKHL